MPWGLPFKMTEEGRPGSISDNQFRHDRRNQGSRGGENVDASTLVGIQRSLLSQSGLDLSAAMRRARWSNLKSGRTSSTRKSSSP